MYCHNDEICDAINPWGIDIGRAMLACFSFTPANSIQAQYLFTPFVKSVKTNQKIDLSFTVMAEATNLIEHAR